MTERPEIILNDPPDDDVLDFPEDEAETQLDDDPGEQASANPARVGTADGGSTAMEVNRPDNGSSGSGNQVRVSRSGTVTRQLYRDVEPSQPKHRRLGHVWIAFAPVLILIVIAVVWVVMTESIEAEDTIEAQHAPQVLANSQLEIPAISDLEFLEKPEPPQIPEPTLPDPSSCNFYSVSGSGLFTRSDAPDTYGKFIVQCADGKLYIAGRTQCKKGVWSHHDIIPYD